MQPACKQGLGAEQPSHRSRAGAYLPWLGLLYGLFVVRVFAQLIQKLHPLPILPPFAAWQSGAVPYASLLLFQILIMGVAGWVLLRLARGRQEPRAWLGYVLLAIGAVYFAVMALRLVASLTFAVHDPWWGATLPALFHVVLASFVVLLGHFHARQGRGP